MYEPPKSDIIQDSKYSEYRETFGWLDDSELISKLPQKLVLDAKKALEDELSSRGIDLDSLKQEVHKENEKPYSSLVVLTSFYTPTEAHIFRNLLNENDIPAFIKDEHLVQTNSFLSSAVGGVGVSVPEEYFRAGTELLQQYESNTYAQSLEHEDNLIKEDVDVKKKPIVLIGFSIIFTLALPASLIRNFF